MRKKWTYVAIVSMMLGVAPVFTGCVDTDEPAGIEQLRGAKAELLKAKAAVEEANAAIKLAQVAYVEAQTREKNAIALQQEMEAERRRLENEWQQLENEEKRAAVEKAIAQLEHDMEEAALEHEKIMVEKQEALEEAKRQYELTMQAIKIAQAIGSAEAQKTLGQLEAAVNEAYDALYASDGDVKSLEEQLYDANKKLYTAIQNKKAGYDTAEDGSRIDASSEDFKEYWPATLEAIKAQREAELAIEQEALKSLQDAAELPVEDTDWRNRVDAMKTEIQGLVAERDQKEVQLKEAEATPEYIDAWQAAYGVFDKMPSDFGDTEEDIADFIETKELEPSKKGTMQLRDEADEKLRAKKNNTDIAIAEYNLPENVEVSDRVMTALGYTKTAGMEENRDYFHYDASEYKWQKLGKDGVKRVAADSADVPQDIQWYLQEKYDKWLKGFETAIIPANEIAQAKAQLTAAQNDVKTAQTNYDNAKKDWEKVLEIISKQQTYTEIDKTAFDKAVSDYNAAYDALSTAISNYNTRLENAYKDGYNAKRDELIFGSILEDQAVAAAFKDADRLAAAKTAWNSPYVEKNQANFESLIINAYVAEANRAAVKTAMEAYIAETAVDREWLAANKATLDKAAQDGADEFIKKQGVPAVGDKKGQAGSDGENSLAAIINASKDALADVYDEAKANDQKTSLTEAVAAFEESAKGFAQSVATSLNAETLVMAPKTTTVDENWFGAGAADAQVGGYDVFVMKNKKIAPAEATAATTVKFNSKWETVPVKTGKLEIEFKEAVDGKTTYTDNTVNALEYRSFLAFGLADRYVAPERYEVENIKKITFAGDDVTGDSKAEILYNKQTIAESKQAIIDAQDDLKALKAALEDGKKAFQAQVAKDYEENFGELQAAYTKAENDHLAATTALSEVREKLFGELDAEIARLTAEIKANRKVMDELKELAWKYLNITWPAENNPNSDDYDKTQPDYTKPQDVYNPNKFAQRLKEAIARQQVIVAEAQQAVQEAQVNLDQATSGEYDGVYYFQFKLDQIQREWDRAYAAYEEAMENLEKGMAAIAQEIDEEQPAE